MSREVISAKEALERLHETGNITDCIIEGKLDASMQIFKQAIFARRAVFVDEVLWSGTTFEENVFYNNSIFNGKVSWIGSHFKRDVRWMETVIRDISFWNSIIFDCDAFWDGAIIESGVIVSSREIFEILRGVKAGVYISLKDYRKG